MMVLVLHFLVCKISYELAGELKPNLHRYNIGHDEDLIRFDDLVLVFFKVTAELNRSNLSICRESVFSENNSYSYLSFRLFSFTC